MKFVDDDDDEIVIAAENGLCLMEYN